MRTILGFPQRYEVRKKLGKERFLRLGNLSPAETRQIQAYLDGIEIIYSIPMKDGSEAMVLVANCPAPTAYSDIHRQYRLSNFAKAIAASIPYKCLLIVRAERAIKLFAFKKHDHQNAFARSVVDEVYSTPDIYITELSSRERELFAAMADARAVSHSSAELNSHWIGLLAGYSGGYGEAVGCANDSFYSYRYQQLLEDDARKGIADRIVDGWFGADYSEIVDEDDGSGESWLSEFNYNDQSDLYGGYALDPDGDAIHRNFLEFCCDISRTVYNAFVPATHRDNESEEQWLRNYIKACNSYANIEFNASLDSRSIQVICDAFRKMDTYPIDVDNQDFSVEYLIEYLSGFYYDSMWIDDEFPDDYEDE